MTSVLSTLKSLLKREADAWTQPSQLEWVAEPKHSDDLAHGQMWAKRDCKKVRRDFDLPDMPDDIPLYALTESDLASIREVVADAERRSSPSMEGRGMVAVPIEPTDEMLDAMSDGVATATGNLRNNWRNVYRALLEAAALSRNDGMEGRDA